MNLEVVPLLSSIKFSVEAKKLCSRHPLFGEIPFPEAGFWLDFRITDTGQKRILARAGNRYSIDQSLYLLNIHQ